MYFDSDYYLSPIPLPGLHNIIHTLVHSFPDDVANSRKNFSDPIERPRFPNSNLCQLQFLYSFSYIAVQFQLPAINFRYVQLKLAINVESNFTHLILLKGLFKICFSQFSIINTHWIITVLYLCSNSWTTVGSHTQTISICVLYWARFFFQMIINNDWTICNRCQFNSMCILIADWYEI